MAVRRESVVLDLQSNLASVAARDAAAFAILNEEVKRLGKSSASARSGTREIERGLDGVESKARRGANSIDQYSGRLQVLSHVAATLGPALVPIGAVGIPAVTGLASSFGFAALGAGTMIGALQGVGDALKALNKANLEPTTENINAAREAMAQISPEARQFTRHLEELVPELQHLRDIGATNMLPGFDQGLRSLERALPVVQRIVGAVSGELGDLGAEAGKSIAGPRWRDFFQFLETEAPVALADMAHGVGNVAHAMAQLWMAFSPVNRDFSSWLLEGTKRLDAWASGLSKTQGFADFLDYLHSEGPAAGEAISSIANALLQVVEAAAPIGGPVLHVVAALADSLAAVADSDIGTPLLTGVAALSALRLATKAWGSVSSTTFAQVIRGQTTLAAQQQKLTMGVRQFGRDAKTAWSYGYLGKNMDKSAAAAQRLSGQLRTVGRGTAVMGGLAVASSGVADKMGLASTASFGLIGLGVGGPVGAAIGAGVGAMVDLSHASDGAQDAIKSLNAAIRSGDVDHLSASIAKANKELDDYAHQTGLKDTLSDGAKVLGDVFHSMFSGDPLRSQQLAYKTSQAQLAREDAKSAVSLRLQAHGFDLTAAGATRAGQALSSFTRETQHMEAALSQRAALRDYQAAIDDFQKSLKENGKTLNINTAAGRANQAQLDNIAGSALKIAEGMKVGSARQTVFLDRARSGFIKAAIQAGMTRQAARRLADQLLSVDRIRANPKLHLDTGPARAQLNAFIRDVTSAHPVVRIGASKPGNLTSLLGGSADGTTVPKTGKPYADRHPYLLADGEEVISNRYGQADRHRDLLKAINANVPQLAFGGTAQGNVQWHSRGRVNAARRTGESHLVAELRALRLAVSRDTARRDALASKRSDLTSSVRGSFTSDPFASTGSVWSAGGGSNPLGALRADIAKARAFKTTLAALHKAGLSGDALASIASTGDLTAAQSLLSSGQAKDYGSLYAQRAAAANAVGQYAGSASYGAAQHVTNAHLARVEHELKVLRAQMAHQHKDSQKNHKGNAREFGKQINHSVGNGKRASRG